MIHLTSWHWYAWAVTLFSVWYIQRRGRRNEWREVRQEIWPIFYYPFFIAIFSWWYWPLMIYYVVTETWTEKKAEEKAEIDKLKRGL